MQSEENYEYFLKNYIQGCEDRMAVILRQYDVYESLYWTRETPFTLYKSTFINIILQKEILVNAIYKYGKLDYDTHEIIINNGLDQYGKCYPKSVYEFLQHCKIKRLTQKQLNQILNEEDPLPTFIVDMLKNFVRVELLSAIFVDTIYEYKLYNLGGELVIDDYEFSFMVQANDGIEKLLNLFINRSTKNNLMSFVGGHMEEFHPTVTEAALTLLHNEPHAPASLLNLRTEGYEQFPNEQDLIFIPDRNIRLQFKLRPINLKDLYNYLIVYEEYFIEKYKFSIKELVLFFKYLTYYFLKNSERSFKYQISILQKGYIIEGNYEEFKKDLVGFIAYFQEDLFGPGSLLENIRVNDIFDLFYITSENRIGINVWHCGPRKIFYQLSENRFLVDFSGIIESIKYLLKDSSTRAGSLGNRRGEEFENVVILSIEKIFNKSSVWVSSRKVRIKGSNNKEKGNMKQIDATLIVDDILFVIEAKSRNVSFEFYRGDRVAIKNRIGEFEDAINQAIEKVKFLVNNKENLTIKLPDKVKYIVPVVISPNIEFIWEFSDKLFLDRAKEVPRVISISDLVELKSLSRNVLRNSCYTFKI